MNAAHSLRCSGTPIGTAEQSVREGIVHDEQVTAPDSTAVRVALWRALHLEVDSPPHVLEDEVGLKLAAPDDGWRSRPDMSPFTRPFRAAIVARARFIEDLVAEQAGRGVGQYVILGAGLDTFAQRRPELASRLLVFEIDRPGPQAWKRQRLVDLGLSIPVVGADGRVGLRFRAAGDRGVHRCQHVPDQGRNRDDADSGRGARSGLYARHVVHASDRAGGARGAPRD